MKPLILLIATVILAEIGVALVWFNASPNAPLGFRVWFGGLSVLVPACAVWVYQRSIRQKVD